VIDADAFNAFEVAGWAGLSASYHRHSGPLTQRLVEPLLDAAGVGPRTRVLDVATGPGYAAAACVARGASAVGLDLSAAMLELARSLHPELELVEGDVERLPFADASFDAAVGNFVVLHLGRPEQAAGELARVLRPRGGVALTTWASDRGGRLPGILLDALEEEGVVPPPHLPPGPPILRFADDAEFARLLAGAGFVDVEVRTIAFAHRFADAEEIWQRLLQGTVRARVLVLEQPPEVQARVRAAFDGLAARHAAGDGIELPVCVKLASGRAPSA
jgi:SAM-dependent methyltransferase